MEAHDAADHIQEAAEEQEHGRGEHRPTQAGGGERFRREAAIIIGVLAMLLAITALGGDQARTTTTNENIRASDTFAFYQAKNIRQTVYQVSAQDLQALLLTRPAPARAAIQKTIARYTAMAAHLEDDPTGAGKKQLLEEAHCHEVARDCAERREPHFNDAQALVQIAIVLGSVSIVAASRALLLASVALGAVATLLMVNGYLLLV